jgi:hypothetical protein
MCFRQGMSPPLSNSDFHWLTKTCSILKKNSSNTLALALWSLEPAGAVIGGVQLVADGAFETALNIKDWNAAPNYAAQKTKREAAKVVPPM